METWQKRDWLSCECCGINGAVEVFTAGWEDTVCDGDKARCVEHGITGHVYEYCGGFYILWDEDNEESNAQLTGSKQPGKGTT
jgi:hypothetical protein